MLESLLQRAVDNHGDRLAIFAPSGNWSYAQFHSEVQLLAEKLRQLKIDSFATYLPDSPQLLALMAAASRADLALAVLDRNYSPGQLEHALTDVNFNLLIIDSEAPPVDSVPTLTLDALNQMQLQSTSPRSGDFIGTGELLIFTSGTTGKPKCVRYQWENLVNQVQTAASDSKHNWLLVYRMNHFAGVQMFVHVLANGAGIILPESHSVADAIRSAAGFGATHVSATPTFWRFALAQMQSGALPQLDLEHITLGSEAVTASVLDGLKSMFPDATISQIYAATEIGSCVSVTDGEPGLPLSVLTRDDTHPVRFKVVDDELWVASRYGMSGYLSESDNAQKASEGEPGWYATGDLVRLTENRISFVGRRSETINVGGVKVHPLDVEAVVENVPGVNAVRAYGRSNPIMGQIVGLEVVPAQGSDLEQLEGRIRNASHALGRHGQPRLIEFVRELRTSNGKLWRGGHSSNDG